jgi:hypothetical protein
MSGSFNCHVPIFFHVNTLSQLDVLEFNGRPIVAKLPSMAGSSLGNYGVTTTVMFSVAVRAPSCATHRRTY